MCNDFELKKAFHAKQAAYDEMTKAREKMSILQQSMTQKYLETEKLQKEYDESRKKQDDEWQEYNDAQLKLKEQIGQKIVSVKECNVLEENFNLMAENPDEDPAKAEVYREGAELFATMAMQKMVERDNLIALKRSVSRPDNYASRQILATLKLARKEHADILEEYHNAKNEFTIKKQNFDRLNEKYNNLRNSDVGNNDESNTYTNRPERLEIDERLLVKAEVPEEYWNNCSIRRRVDGRIDIYYGGDDENSHGHVVIFDDKIEYARLPQAKNFIMV